MERNVKERKAVRSAKERKEKESNVRKASGVNKQKGEKRIEEVSKQQQKKKQKGPFRFLWFLFLFQKSIIFCNFDFAIKESSSSPLRLRDGVNCGSR